MAPNWLHPQQQQQQHQFTVSDNRGYFWSYHSGVQQGDTSEHHSDIRRSKSCERLPAWHSPKAPSSPSPSNQNWDPKCSSKIRQSTSHSNLFTCGSEKMIRKKKAVTITPAVNVYMTSMTMEYISRHEMLGWVNKVLGSDYQSIGDLGNGVAYCQFMNMLFPGLIPLNRVKYRINLRHEAVQNFEILQMAFNKVQVDKVIPSQKLINGRFRDNFEFLKWFRKFYAANYIGAVHPITKHFENQNNARLSSSSQKSVQDDAPHLLENSSTSPMIPGPSIVVNDDHQRLSRDRRVQKGW